MVVCYQYWFTPYPKYGKDVESRTVICDYPPIIMNWRAKGVYDLVVVWKIKKKSMIGKVWKIIKEMFRWPPRQNIK